MNIYIFCKKQEKKTFFINFNSKKLCARKVAFELFDYI